MKKFLKILIIIIAIIILLFFINFIRNYFILKRVYDIGNNFNQGNNYRIQEKVITSHSDNIINYYYLNDRYLYIEENDNTEKYNRIIFHNISTNEYNEFTADENGDLTHVDVQQKNDQTEYIKTFIYCKSYEFSDLLKKNIFKIIKEDDECYIINISNQDEYVNKETGLLSKIKSSTNNIVLEMKFEKNVVDEKTLDINQYSI